MNRALANAWPDLMECTSWEFRQRILLREIAEVERVMRERDIRPHLTDDHLGDASERREAE